MVYIIEINVTFMNKQALTIICLFLSVVLYAQRANNVTYSYGAVVRGDSTKKEVALVFTADEYGEGIPAILQSLQKDSITGSFFFTGRFYRNPAFRQYVLQLQRDAHYLGPHSDQHLLYCDWSKRDSVLVSRDSFQVDLIHNIDMMKKLSIHIRDPHFFIPPFEWWNDSVAIWSRASALRLISFTPGIRTPADYTWPELGTTYRSSEWIMNSLKNLISITPEKLNGAIILIHAGTDPRRKDKFYDRLPELIAMLKSNGYSIRSLEELLPSL